MKSLKEIATTLKEVAGKGSSKLPSFFDAVQKIYIAELRHNEFLISSGIIDNDTSLPETDF